MGKRSNFQRMKGDFYVTPPEAVAPLLARLNGYFSFSEPCAGDGSLVRALIAPGNHCSFQSDIEPRCEKIIKMDAMLAPEKWFARSKYIITNPPWTRSILHPMIERFASIKPTWLLFDADWMHTRQAAEYLAYCTEIVSVGRVKWIADSPHVGKDNAAWYCFDKSAAKALPVFHRRAA